MLFDSASSGHLKNCSFWHFLLASFFSVLCCETDRNSTTQTYLIVKEIAGKTNYLDEISNLPKWKINVHPPLAGLPFSVLIKTLEGCSNFRSSFGTSDFTAACTLHCGEKLTSLHLKLQLCG